jgi:hypothetical protein
MIVDPPFCIHSFKRCLIYEKYWQFQPSPSVSSPYKLHYGDKYQICIHQAKRQLDAAMDVIFRFLKDIGVSPAT